MALVNNKKRGAENYFLPPFFEVLFHQKHFLCDSLSS